MSEQAPFRHWQDALADGHLLLQRDPGSGEAIFPPRLATHDGSAPEWIEASGDGTVYSVTVVRPRPPAEPYNVVLVDLAEGARMMSRVDGVAADEVTIGMAVRAAVAVEDGEPIVVFHPA